MASNHMPSDVLAARGYIETAPGSGVFAKPSIAAAVARQDAARAQLSGNPGQLPAPTIKPGLTVAPAKGSKESTLQSACESLLRREGVRRAFHVPPKARAMIGWPDLVFIHHGTAHACELKRVGELPRDSQMECLSEMQTDGWYVSVVQTYEEMQELLAGVTVGGARLRWQSCLVDWLEKQSATP